MMMKYLSTLLMLLMVCDAEVQQIQAALGEELLENQDELTADVQELVELQTEGKVIDKLEEMESSMVQATLMLLEQKTGAQTIAIQTDIIEKAYEAAQEKSKASQGENGKPSDTNKAMMDMMEKMLGKPKESDKGKPGKASGAQKGSGKPQEGEAGAAQDHELKAGPSAAPRRQVPSVSAYPGHLLPDEFSSLLDAYNSN